MELVVLVIIVLAATTLYWSIRASKLKKEVANQKFLIDAKDDIIENLNEEKKRLKESIISQKIVIERKSKELLDAFKEIEEKDIRIPELEEQVSLMVSQINKTGVRRNEKGRFVSVD